MVSPSLQRINQRLARKVPGGTNLAAFENGPRALLAALPPAKLVLEQRIKKSAFQLLYLFVRKIVFAARLLWPSIARIDGRVQIGLTPRAFVFADAGQAFQLAAQQVNFLEVAARLYVLGNQR